MKIELGLSEVRVRSFVEFELERIIGSNGDYGSLTEGGKLGFV